MSTEQPKNEPDFRNSIEDATAEVAEPIGTFAGITDYVVRIRAGHAVAANTGDQGGGQN